MMGSGKTFTVGGDTGFESTKPANPMKCEYCDYTGSGACREKAAAIFCMAAAKSHDKPANPKQLFGDKKPDLRLLPLTAQLAQWGAHKDGANKYGPFNWRESPVEANTYVNAAKRHLELFAAGEDFSRDTNVDNLGAVMACCAILIDARAHNTMVDNRFKSQVDCDAMHAAESMVLYLRELQEKRDNG